MPWIRVFVAPSFFSTQTLSQNPTCVPQTRTPRLPPKSTISCSNASVVLGLSFTSLMEDITQQELPNTEEHEMPISPSELARLLNVLLCGFH